MKQIKQSILFVSLLLPMTISCNKDLVEMNKNPQEVETPSIPGLFNKVVSESSFTLHKNLTLLYNELYFPYSQLTATSKKLGVDPILGSNTSNWTSYYTMLAHQRKLEDLLNNYAGDKASLVNVQAMLKVISAMKTLEAVDVFGDIPYTRAGYAYFTGTQQVLRPAFDDATGVYKTVLTDLKWASDHIVTDPTARTPSGSLYYTLDAADVLFGNKMLLWQKFSNALRLRYAARIYEKDAATGGAIIKEVLDNNQPLPAEGEDVQFLRLAGDRPQVSFAAAGSNGVRMGTNIWKCVSSSNATDGSGIFDPRVPVFFETNKQGQWKPYPQAPGTGAPVDNGDPYNGDRNNRIKSDFSAVNYDLIMDVKALPDIAISTAEVNFLKAEAYQRGMGVGKDVNKAGQAYLQGIRESVSFWYKVVAKVEVWNNRPVAPDATKLDAFLRHPQVAFPTGDDQQLRAIYRQYWLSLFWQPNEAFYLLRRTGGMTPTDAPVDMSFSRLNYPASERLDNTEYYNAQVSKMGGDDIGKKIWWMK
ncbi:SusD/RagB family nutrient-binding outer membrane lipoprotein [Chitinophaga pendula]|uniref:SusD/RagB family nutrient-binding outer membrane lipoprotein n=1 Tax=Chitinophaga TaxID=79328 RepID=UPI000BB02C3A|nr:MULTISPECIES: SusD/RagB family nutrient-binding outer membrane lipoprotein [Chitinophaga]ASZ10661.1 hypothetical protein CK934_06545 [Chitinophaga sp. MD30]UCJ06363.1 SusD/RagB family nutrient-binding outer membrane lipoprotein [Chitinophaga pendula]